MIKNKYSLLIVLFLFSVITCSRQPDQTTEHSEIRNAESSVVASSPEIIGTFAKITSSGFLYDSANKFRYSPDKLFDGDLSTCWSEGALDNGFGDNINIEFSNSIPVNRLRIWRGYDHLDYFSRNNRLKGFELWINGDLVRSEQVSDDDNYIDIELSAITNIESLSFVILETYPGTDWDDTAISEIEFFRNDEKIKLANYAEAFSNYYTPEIFPQFSRTYSTDGILLETNEYQYSSGDLISINRTVIFSPFDSQSFQYNETGKLTRSYQSTNIMSPGNNSNSMYLYDDEGRLAQTITEANYEHTDSPFIRDYIYDQDRLIRIVGQQDDYQTELEYSYNTAGNIESETFTVNSSDRYQKLFEYSNDLIVKEVYTSGSSRRVTSYQYLGNQLISETIQHNSGRTDIFRYYYEGELLSKKIQYSRRGNLLNVIGYTIYSYDLSKNLINQIEWQYGGYQTNFVFHYNDENKIESSEPVQSEFIYEDGMLVERNYLRLSAENSRVEYIYSDNQKIEIRTDKKMDGTISLISYYYYDEIGRLARERAFNTDGLLIRSVSYFY